MGIIPVPWSHTTILSHHHVLFHPFDSASSLHRLPPHPVLLQSYSPSSRHTSAPYRMASSHQLCFSCGNNEVYQSVTLPFVWMVSPHLANIPEFILIWHRCNSWKSSTIRQAEPSCWPTSTTMSMPSLTPKLLCDGKFEGQQQARYSFANIEQSEATVWSLLE